MILHDTDANCHYLRLSPEQHRSSPPYGTSKRATMKIATECIVVNHPFRLERRLWEELEGRGVLFSRKKKRRDNVRRVFRSGLPWSRMAAERLRRV